MDDAVHPDFLAIGHIAKDLTPDGFTVGGAVTYGALTSKALGPRPAVVTSAAPEIDLSFALPDVAVHNVRSSTTTTFLNTYNDGRRIQHLSDVAAPIAPTDIPKHWRSSPLVLLGPLAGELDHEMATYFPDAIVVASIQGWLRRRDGDGRVWPVDWDGGDVLPFVHTAILSIDDVADMRPVERWITQVPVLIYTKGKDGANVHHNGEWHHIDAFDVREVDPTGAGDVFAAAYLVRYRETKDVLNSARFASCAASLSVQAQGASGIPTRGQIEARLSAY